MNQPSRPRHSAKEWSAFIHRQASSGQSQRDFCLSEGLSLSTFTYWKRKLGARVARSGAEGEAPLFTPIQALPAFDDARPDSDDAGRGGWTLNLDLGDGLRLTLRKFA